ncbi:MAG: PaaI family thioesterase [Paracoccaceae bacterium]
MSAGGGAGPHGPEREAGHDRTETREGDDRAGARERDDRAEARETERDRALDALAGSVPYNRLIGVVFERRGDEVTARLPFAPRLVGNPLIPALHGGVIGSFLEITGLVQLAWERLAVDLDQGGPAAAAIVEGRLPPIPKTVDINIDYLRSGRPRDSFARARVQKSGRRVAHVHVEAWQDERARPIAMLRGNFLLPEG